MKRGGASSRAMTPSATTRLRTGSAAPAFTRPTLAHGSVSVPDGRPLHLQFRRFAGCPICSLHLRSLARSLPELERRGIASVVVFHSPLEELRTYHESLPFPVVGDPSFELYRAYGVERSLRGVLHPRVMASALKGLMLAPSSPLARSGGVTGLPAEFLVDETGHVLHAHYAAHADDHLEIDAVLAHFSRREAGSRGTERGPRAGLASHEIDQGISKSPS